MYTQPFINIAIKILHYKPIKVLCKRSDLMFIQYSAISNVNIDGATLLGTECCKETQHKGCDRITLLFKSGMRRILCRPN